MATGGRYVERGPEAAEERGADLGGSISVGPLEPEETADKIVLLGYLGGEYNLAGDSGNPEPWHLDAAGGERTSWSYQADAKGVVAHPDRRHHATCDGQKPGVLG